MTKQQGAFSFVDPTLKDFTNPDLNVYLKQYWSSGPPVLRGCDAQKCCSDWDAFFGRKAPLKLEVGAGNGFFLAGMAAKDPQSNWLGLEIRYKRVMLCARKILSEQIQNARIMRYDAWLVHELFSQGSLSALYTNHPDPWQKKRQAKKRLLNADFCLWASQALKVGGVWRIKTDFKPHIESVLEHTENLPFKVTGRSEDTHTQGVPWSPDIETNYESKFRLKGLPVFALELERV